MLSLTTAVLTGCNLLGLSEDDNNDDTTTLAAVLSLANTAYTVNFTAVDANNTAFSCGNTIASNGADAAGNVSATYTPEDLRLYISSISLLDFSGNAVPVTMSDDGVWQYQGSALLDFEDGTGNCATSLLNGATTATNRSINFTAPAGNYMGIRLTMGLPYALNQLDNSTAASPLNINAMYWNWTAGFKFIKFEFRDADSKASFHLGSQSCTGITMTDCSQPYRPTFDITSSTGFNPATDMVALDLNALLKNFPSSFTDSSGESFKRCMVNASDADCAKLLTNLGLDTTTGGASGTTSTVFRIMNN